MGSRPGPGHILAPIFHTPPLLQMVVFSAILHTTTYYLLYMIWKQLEFISGSRQRNNIKVVLTSPESSKVYMYGDGK